MFFHSVSLSIIEQPEILDTLSRKSFSADNLTDKSSRHAVPKSCPFCSRPISLTIFMTSFIAIYPKFREYRLEAILVTISALEMASEEEVL